MNTALTTDIILLHPVKEKKNTRRFCAGRRLILLTVPKRIKTIRNKVFNRHVYILQRLQRFMAISHTGQQRFVNVAWRYMLLNGAMSSSECFSYMRNNHPKSTRTMTQRKVSSLFAIHPMFRKVGMTNYCNGRNKYKVGLYEAVPERVVVNNLYQNMSQGKHIMFSFRKYPTFIRRQVTALLDADNESDSPKQPTDINQHWKPQPFN